MTIRRRRDRGDGLATIAGATLIVGMLFCLLWELSKTREQLSTDIRRIADAVALYSKGGTP